MTFTPEPWQVVEVPGGRCYVQVFPGRPLTHLVSPADARLIAAASELLFLLKTLEPWLRIEYDTTDIRALLSRIEGVTPKKGSDPGPPEHETKRR